MLARLGRAGSVSAPRLQSLSLRSTTTYSTYKRREVVPHYGTRPIKKKFVIKKKPDPNPFDSEVGTWHEDKWYPPGVTEFHYRSMDQWNSSPYDPPEVTHEFQKKTSDFLLDWKFVRSKVLIINRAAELNGFDLKTINRLEELLFKYGNQDRSSAATFLIGSQSAAFSTGTNYLNVSQQIQSDDTKEQAKARKYFLDLYSAVATAHESRVPLLTVMDGLTLGSAATLAISSGWSVATDRTIIAWTEPAMGFFPDAGASFFLAKLPKEIGTYMALTGSRLQSTNAVKAGLAAHALEVSAIDVLRENIEDINGIRSPLKLLELIDWIDVRDSNPFALKKHLDVIERCFSKDSVKEIMAALEDEGTPWALKKLEAMKKASPLSLTVTLRALRSAAKHDRLVQTLKQDFVVAMRMLEKPDFAEGVRKKIVVEEEPVWQHASVEDVTEAEVDALFAPFTREEERKYQVAADSKERSQFLQWRTKAVHHRQRRPRQYPVVREAPRRGLPDPESSKATIEAFLDTQGVSKKLAESLKESPELAKQYRHTLRQRRVVVKDQPVAEKILGSMSGLHLASSMHYEHLWEEPEFKKNTWRPFSHKDAIVDIEEANKKIADAMDLEADIEKEIAQQVEFTDQLLIRNMTR